MSGRPTDISRPVRWGAWAVVAFLILPVTVVIPISLTDHRYLSLPSERLSGEHFANLFGSAAWLSDRWVALISGNGGIVLYDAVADEAIRPDLPLSTTVQQLVWSRA